MLRCRVVPSFGSSASGTKNSANPQSKQTAISVNMPTLGFSKPSQPGKWTFISAPNLFSLFDEHRLQIMNSRVDMLAASVFVEWVDYCAVGRRLRIAKWSAQSPPI